MTPPTRVERAWQLYLAMIQGLYAQPNDHPVNFEFQAKAAFNAERKFMEEAGR